MSAGNHLKGLCQIHFVNFSFAKMEAKSPRYNFGFYPYQIGDGESRAVIFIKNTIVMVNIYTMIPKLRGSDVNQDSE